MKMKTKYIQTVVVLDPDTGAQVSLEIRKQEDGLMVGLDMEGYEDGDYYSPYDESVLLDIPDDEHAGTSQ